MHWAIIRWKFSLYLLDIYIYFIKQFRHPLSRHFCIYPFKSPSWFYGNRWELVNETPIINWLPSTFCLILGHHQGCVYCKSDELFACTSLLCKCWTFIIFTQLLRLGRIWHNVNFKRSLTGLNSEFSLS